ncbi:MAG TPA: beta-ketoacyl-ACP synthase III [Nannocystis exedens]|nr:beta-ketoacyl-ACP synthase III [Nannocystis exedens]
MIPIHITGTGLYTPTDSISNEELVATFNRYVELHNAEYADEIRSGRRAALQPSGVEFIVKASGIRKRFVMEKRGILNPEIMCPRIPERGDDEQSLQCEMAICAAKEALAQAGKTAADLDAVLVACSNHQRSYPAIAIEVQAALGIDGFAVDMNMACSSATFGIQAAVNAIRGGSARSVLVVNPEICTGHLNFRDRDSHFIFGDACTAIIIERAEDSRGEGAFEVLGTRLRTRFSNNIRNNRGFLNRTYPETQGDADKLFYQQGRKVFREVVPMVSELISTHLADAGIAVDSVRRMWLHQANLNMNKLISKRVLGRPATDEEAPTILDTYANTSSAGSIIAFHLHRSGLQSGDLGVICSFGAGYSMGSVLVRQV